MKSYDHSDLDNGLNLKSYGDSSSSLKLKSYDNTDVDSFVPSPQKPKHYLDQFEEDVPYVGDTLGAIQAIGGMTGQFITHGLESTAKYIGGIDIKDQDKLSTWSGFEPKTETGRDIVEAVGIAMQWWYDKTANVTESLVNQLPDGTPAPIQGVTGAMGELTREAIPLFLPGLIPYAPRYVAEKIKRSPENNTGTPVTNERISLDEFSKVYKDENPKASVGEISGAWSEYMGNGVHDAYTFLANNPTFKRKPKDPDVQASVSSRTPDKPLTFKEQLDVIKDSPITLTKQEFTQGIKTAGYAKPVAALKAEKKAIQSLLPNLIDKKKIQNLTKRIEQIDADLKALAGDIRSRKTQNLIDDAYAKYLAERGTSYDTLFEHRQREASNIKLMQEEYMWQQFEQQSGTGRIVNQMKIAELPTEVASKAAEQITASMSSKNKLPPEQSKPQAVDIQATQMEVKQYVKSKEKKSGNVSDDSTPHTTKLSQELRPFYSPGISFDTFKSNIKGKYAGFPDHIVKAIYDKIKQSPKTELKAPNDSGYFESKLPLSQKEWGFWEWFPNAVAGKPLSMLFEKARMSPSLQAIMDKITHKEIQQYGEGQFRTETPIVLAQQQRAAEFSIRLQNIYDAAQIKLGGGTFVGPKNLVPELLGGWGGKSLPSRIDSMLFDVMNGSKRTDIPESVSFIAKELRVILDDVYKYLKESGLDVQYLDNYFPRNWNVDAIKANLESFEAMLKKKGYKDKSIENIILTLAENGGMLELPMKNGEFRSKMLHTDMRNSKIAVHAETNRMLQGLTPDEIRPYVETNVHQTLSKYIDQVTRRAEFSKRFGVDQKVLDELFVKAQKELMESGNPLTMQEAKRIYDVIDALQGLHNPVKNKHILGMMRWSRSLFSFAALGFAAIRSVPEVWLALNDGGVRAMAMAMPKAISTSIRSIVRNNISKRIPKNELMELADALGKSGEVAMMHHTNGLLSGITPTALDNFTFATNLQHAWTRHMNYFAIEVFRQKTNRLAKQWSKSNKSDPTNERLYNYLGINRQDLVNWHNRGLGEKDPYYSETIKTGAHIFAEDIVLTPNAVNRPLFHNDPHWMLVSYLKGFPTLMGNKVLKRMAVDIMYSMRNVAEAPEMTAKWMATTVAGVITAKMIAELIDYLQYGEQGNPRVNMMDDHEVWIRAIRMFGLGGMGSSMIDGLQMGEHSTFGYFGAVVGVPALEVPNDFLSIIAGIYEWQAGPVADGLVRYVKGFLNIAQKTGMLNEDALTRKEIKKFLTSMLNDYFGMKLTDDKGGGISPLRAR